MTSTLLMLVCVVAAPPNVDALPVEAASTSDAVHNANIVDGRVFPRLAELGIEPSAVSSDTVFLRRLSLTTIGQLPTPEEIRSFAADARDDKRTRKIDELLGHDLHAAMWATRFSEWTGNGLETLAADDEAKLQLSQLWHRWLRDRFARNEPYDRIVRSIVTARSRSNNLQVGEWVTKEAAMTMSIRRRDATAYADRESLDLFWRRTEIQGQYPVREIAERIASTFLGVRINCARCHDHPFDPWTQRDYEAFVRTFAQVRHDMSPELRQEISTRLAERRRRFANGEPAGPTMPRITEVYVTRLPEDANLPRPKALGGPDFDCDQHDLREALMDWMDDPQNPFFARNFVNRVWAHYFGRGLIEPLDGLTSQSGNASYPELLDSLAQRFVASGYDIRQLETLILNSRTWQLSSEPTASNRDDQRYFARAYVRLPPAEVVIDMWHAGTGIERDFGNEVFRGLHAIELGPDRLPDNRWDAFLTLFGQPKRANTCDCSPKSRPSVRQALTLMSDPKLIADVSRGSLARLLADEMSDDELLDELFLQTLSRWPTPEERSAVQQASAAADRRAAWESVLWSLLNTQEFITIH